ncbi:unnamed protein product [Effrenium voratum]|nr:unnamed protein product [Effrenium voratum]
METATKRRALAHAPSHDHACDCAGAAPDPLQEKLSALAPATECTPDCAMSTPTPAAAYWRGPNDPASAGARRRQEASLLAVIPLHSLGPIWNDLQDLMLLVYNGGLAAHAELPSMHPSEVQALWPRLMRQMPALLQRHGGIRKAVAAGRMWQEQDELAPLESAPKDGRRPSKDRRPSGSAAGAGKEQDHERVSLTGVQEFSVLLEKLYENEKLKSRFSSPLEMIVSSVLHAQSCGHIWEEEKFSEAGAPLKF